MRSLRARLAWFYGALVVVVLCAFAGTVWAIIEAQEATEPPEVAELEGPDYTGRRMLIALGLALPVGVAVAALGAVIIARRGLAPLDDVIETTLRISADRLHERIAERPDSVDEVARLVRAVNAMLERLEHSVEGMRRFTADASHELRTPLAALLGDLEVTLRRERTPEELRATVERTLEEVGRLSRLVESLLTLAQSDAGGLPTQPVELALDELVRRTVEPYQAVLAGGNVALTLSLGERVTVKTDPLWAGRVIANLVDNAAKHTPPGGTVTVALAGATVEVSDSGPGIPAEDRARIFERFFRGQAARAGAPGFGLGLALGREIAHALGGELTLEPSESGARFAFTLPSGEASSRRAADRIPAA